MNHRNIIDELKLRWILNQIKGFQIIKFVSNGTGIFKQILGSITYRTWEGAFLIKKLAVMKEKMFCGLYIMSPAT